MAGMRTVVPPIKLQGIKTKLIPFILDTLDWDGNGTWYESFLGSGCVLFNVLPGKAIVNDRNEHIINFYRSIQNGTITDKSVRDYLEREGDKLRHGGADYYYEVRARFNVRHDPYDFLFLNRSCFNGLMRFNRTGGFNVPFCQQPERFSKSYITKICNQVRTAFQLMRDRDWEFRCGDWRDIMGLPVSGDYVYLDPPYIGLNTNYVGEWPESEAKELAERVHGSPARVMLSMWKETKCRKNGHIDECWSDFTVHEFNHFYHVGSKVSFRHPVTEVLLTSV